METSDSDMDATQVPPHSIEAEQSVLGAMLLDPEARWRVRDLLAESDFHVPRHREIYQAVLSLPSQQPADLIIVSDALKQAGLLERVGGPQYLMDLVNLTPTTANVEGYAQIVAHKARCRRAQQVLMQQLQRLYRAAEDDLTEIAASLRAAVEDGPARNYEDVRSFGEVATEQVRVLRQREPGSLVGSPWGFKGLNYQTPGLEKRNMYVVAARPSMGKTGLVVEITRRNAQATKKPTLLVTAEDNVAALAERQMSALAQVSNTDLRRAKLTVVEWPRVDKAAEDLRAIPLWATQECITVADIRSRARWLKEQYGDLGLITVDYLQLLQLSRGKRAENRQQEVSEISRELKGLAKDMDCPVLVASQLSRAVEQRQDKRPILSDLRESGAIEQDAHCVIGLYRDDYYHPNSETPGVVEAIILKQKGGPVGTVRLGWRREWQLWTDIEERRDR